MDKSLILNTQSHIVYKNGRNNTGWIHLTIPLKTHRGIHLTIHLKHIKVQCYINTPVSMAKSQRITKRELWWQYHCDDRTKTFIADFERWRNRHSSIRWWAKQTMRPYEGLCNKTKPGRSGLPDIAVSAATACVKADTVLPGRPVRPRSALLQVGEGNALFGTSAKAWRDVTWHDKKFYGDDLLCFRCCLFVSVCLLF